MKKNIHLPSPHTPLRLSFQMQGSNFGGAHLPPSRLCLGDAIARRHVRRRLGSVPVGERAAVLLGQPFDLRLRLGNVLARHLRLIG